MGAGWQRCGRAEELSPAVRCPGSPALDAGLEPLLRVARLEKDQKTRFSEAVMALLSPFPPSQGHPVYCLRSSDLVLEQSLYSSYSSAPAHAAHQRWLRAETEQGKDGREEAPGLGHSEQLSKGI